MAIKHVEIHQIAKDQSTRALAKGSSELVHAVCIALCGDVIFYAATVVDVVNLADPEHRHAALLQYIEQHRLRRIHRVVVPPRSTHKVPSLACKRPCNDAPYAMRAIQQFSSDF